VIAEGMKVSKMKALKSAILFILLVMGTCSHASAESTAQAMQAFGLIGTWSLDCAKDPLKGGVRDTYAVSILGTATASEIGSFHTGSDVPSSYVFFKEETEIKQAIRVTEEKIKLIQIHTSWANVKDNASTPPIYTTLENLRLQVGTREIERIIMKKDGKIQTIESHSVDDKIILVRNTEIYRPQIDDKTGNADWTKTRGIGTVVKAWERCLN
jgi:hypothetical protein